MCVCVCGGDILIKCKFHKHLKIQNKNLHKIIMIGFSFIPVKACHYFFFKWSSSYPLCVFMACPLTFSTNCFLWLRERNKKCVHSNLKTVPLRAGSGFGRVQQPLGFRVLTYCHIVASENRKPFQ